MRRISAPSPAAPDQLFTAINTTPLIDVMLVLMIGDRYSGPEPQSSGAVA